MPDDGRSHLTFDYPGGAMPQALANAGVPAPDNGVASNGMVVTIGEDGGVYFDPPKPAIRTQRTDDFHANLTNEIPDNVLGQIANDYLTGVAADIMSRSEFISNYNRGIDLLGLKIEEASRTKGPRSSISRVKDPLLLEGCVHYQSAARSELLPAAGPVKVSTIGDTDSVENQLARDFESDFNYYLTDIATEYYPDTDRALFYQGYGGSTYKKIYKCPVRRRPVSESVQLTHLIVSEDATDLDNAVRITHELNPSRSVMRRMQLAGAWRDINLGQPMGSTNIARRKILESQGLAPVTTRPQDQAYTVYEGYTDILLDDYGWVDHRSPEGLPVPYRIAVDKDSQQILAIHRNWKEGDEDFLKRKTFVKFGLVPGLGFLDYGFLHLVGNHARALSAIWQLLTDAGMFANFPGGVKAKGVRTSTNDIAPGLGEWVDIDIGEFDDIRKALMAMPYKDPNPVFIQLAELIRQDAQKLIGTVEIEVGEGRTNVPVGTILAMIEQQTQVMGAIHKRNHTAQKQELMLLRDLFAEDPRSLWQLARKPARRWETAAEFSDIDLSPASDPNVPAQMHRIMQATVLEQMGTGDQLNLDRKAIHRRSFQAMNISDGDELLLPGPSAQPQPAGGAPQPAQNPAAGLAAAKLQMELPLKQQQNQLQSLKLQNQIVETQRTAAAQAEEFRQRAADREQDRQFKQADLALEYARLHREHLTNLAGLAMDHVHHNDTLAQTERLHRPALTPFEE